jgi:hypothetical protein
VRDYSYRERHGEVAFPQSRKIVEKQAPGAHQPVLKAAEQKG